MRIFFLLMCSLFVLNSCSGSPKNEAPEQVLNFWFGELASPEDFPEKQSKMWFRGGPQVDKEIHDHFETLLLKAKNQELAHWKKTPRGRLALIILFDQFSRNMYRGTPRAFEFDPMALQLTLEGITQGEERELFPAERVFLYMPLQHAEDLSIQELSVKKFNQLANEVPPSLFDMFDMYADYAVKHYQVISQFGRFPHRNAILGRKSTDQEIEFLQKKGE